MKNNIKGIQIECIIPLCFKNLGIIGIIFPNVLLLWSISGNIDPTKTNIKETKSLQINNDNAIPPVMCVLPVNYVLILELLN